MNKKSKVQNYLLTKIKERGVLIKDGDFRLNSGEHSSFYFDFSKFSDSKGLTELGFIFWSEIQEMDFLPDVVFGVATKGIILATAACFYSFHFGNKVKDVNLSFAFDRKEKKEHGEGGDYVGSDIRDKSVLIIDDVLISGRAMKRSLETVKKYTSNIHLMVMINRSSIKEIDGFPLKSVISFDENKNYF